MIEYVAHLLNIIASGPDETKGVIRDEVRCPLVVPNVLETMGSDVSIFSIQWKIF